MIRSAALLDGRKAAEVPTDLAGAGSSDCCRPLAARSTPVVTDCRVNHGRIVKLTGDGVLVEFPSEIDAVE
jgi:class 3 adenylate cyclase